MAIKIALYWLWLWLPLQASAGSANVRQDEKDVRSLEPGYPIQREITWSEAHFYQISLAANQYLHVVVDQRQADLTATLFGPDSRQIAYFDSRWFGAEPISLIAEVSGVYRLTLRLREKLSIPARYEIKIDQLRPSVPADGDRIASERMSTSGKQLLLQETNKSRPEAVKKYEEALALWRRIGDQAEEAQTLHSLGYLYTAIGDRQRAIECYEQALEIRRRVGDVAGEAQTLHNLGVASVLMDQSKYYQQALERWRAAQDRRGEARTLCNLARLYLLKSRQQALEHFDLALQLARAAGAPQEQAQALIGLGFIESLTGKPREAIGHSLLALSLAQFAEDRQAESAALNNLGKLYTDLGEIRKALEYLEQAAVLSPDSADRRARIAVAINLGSLYSLVGEPRKAIEYYEQALSLTRESNDRRGEANTLNNLGQMYADLGERQKAIECFNQATSLSRQLGDRSIEAAALNNLGNVSNDLGEPQKSLAYHTPAWQIFHDLGEARNEAYTLSNIGVIHNNLGQHEKALEVLRRALAIRQTTGDRRGQTYTLNHLGLAYLSSGKKLEALDCFRQALALAQGANNLPVEAYSLTSLAGAYSAMGEKRQAREAYQQALRLWQTISNPQREAITLHNLAAVERDLGEPDQARAHLEAALRIVESLRVKVADQELRTSYFATAQSSYQLYIDLLTQMDQSRPGEGFAAMALHAIERARARSLLELLAEAEHEIKQGVDPALQQREQANQTKLSWLYTQLILERTQPGIDQKKGIATLIAEVKQAEDEREQLEKEIRRTNPKYAEIYYPEPLKYEAIQSLLDDQTVLLEFALGSERSSLFVVSSEGLKIYTLPPATEIEPLAQELRTLFQQTGRREFSRFVRTARKLYETLIAPASAEIAQKRNLIIVPDGKLHYLPFEALLTQETKTGGRADYRSLDYLLKRWTVSYAPSASALASLRAGLRQNQEHAQSQPPKAAAKQFVAFADPVYQAGAEHSQFQRLADSSREVGRIARFYQPQDVALYLQQAASEENVKDNPFLSNARRIHFAAHGEISESQPQSSALVLTLDNDPREDGMLRVYEIFNLKLNADLVVLSACRTGMGKELKGEGVIGMTRAFFYAGTPSIVVSLWQVADHSTADLMIKFYQHLNHTTNKADALRRAKLDLIGTGHYAHPYYWAPFVLIGESNQSHER